MFKHKILLVEDEPNYASVVKRMIEYANFDVIHTHNGHEALKIVSTTMPHLVICDVCMPVMNGYQFYKTFRALPEANNIPFLFLTSLSTQEELRMGMALGAEGYLSKSISRIDLMNTINVQLNKKTIIDAEVEVLIETHLKKVQSKAENVLECSPKSLSMKAQLSVLTELLQMLNHSILDDGNKIQLMKMKTVIGKLYRENAPL